MRPVVCLVTALSAVSLGNDINIENNCTFTIWPGILGTSDGEQPEHDGFALETKQNETITVSEHWAGVIWARTNCSENFECETGNCGHKIQCNEGFVPPASYAEFAIAGSDGDVFKVTFVSGFNLPMTITPTDGYFTDNGTYGCTTAGCKTDLNKICPEILSVKSGQSTIGCISPCFKYRSAKYCCVDDYGSPNTCKPAEWFFDYPGEFKKACPKASSYDFDDNTSLFHCKGNPATNYKIVFCP